MAHEIDMSTGTAAIAYVGDKPWHGLGNPLTKGATIETWTKSAGMNFNINSSPALFQIPGSKDFSEVPERQVLWRDDTKASLSIVSDSYKVVQPREILEFFRSLVEKQGMELETAGCLFGGRRFWALANTNMETDVIKNDRVKGMLLLTTSCDGTLATTAKFTSVRVVCNNTLRISMSEDSANAARVSHSSIFDPEKIKGALGLLDSSWNMFMRDLKKMSRTKFTDSDAKKFFASIMLTPMQMEQFVKEESSLHARIQTKLDTMMGMYNGDAMGADIAGKTLWGALNVVTEYADHRIGRVEDNMLWNSWFGFGDNLKNAAFKKAIELV